MLGAPRQRQAMFCRPHRKSPPCGGSVLFTREGWGAPALWLSQCTISAVTSQASPIGSALSSPGRHRDDAMLLAEIASGRRDDRALGHHQLTAGLERLADVFFTDEV